MFFPLPHIKSHPIVTGLAVVSFSFIEQFDWHEVRELLIGTAHCNWPDNHLFLIYSVV